jgi:hypothetical protein
MIAGRLFINTSDLSLDAPCPSPERMPAGQFVGTSRFSSSNQSRTTTICGAAA